MPAPKKNKDAAPVHNRPLMELGQKSRAGKMLSEYLRGVLCEKTELIRDPDTGRTKVVSKGEALARKICEKALGLEWDEESNSYIEVGISLDWVKLLIDRVEGRAGVNGNKQDEDDGKTVADRVSESNKNRLNKMAGDE